MDHLDLDDYKPVPVQTDKTLLLVSKECFEHMKKWKARCLAAEVLYDWAYHSWSCPANYKEAALDECDCGLTNARNEWLKLKREMDET